ncbi:MAG: zinc ribbon domain-containing protein [Candidatus Sumerlaeia bacterium]|nr:zinc ribbon domain-containing protein [Candidatus Sumerlaeia bacterium]
MPVYEYQVAEGHDGCETCRDGFQILQSMKDDALTTCPECGAPIRKLIFPVGISTPKTNSELKNLGFTKLVKRDTGVYENVTALNKESRYMEAGKPDTMPHLHKKIGD